MMGNGFGMGFGGGFFMLLFWILLIVLVIWGVKALVGGSKDSSTSGKSAQDILDERYARGEINKEEFEEKRKDLIG